MQFTSDRQESMNKVKKPGIAFVIDYFLLPIDYFSEVKLKISINCWGQTLLFTIFDFSLRVLCSFVVRKKPVLIGV